MGLDDLLQSVEECGNLRVGSQIELNRFTGALQAVQMQRAFAQSLAGNRSAIDAAAADTAFPLDERDTFPGPSPLDCRFLSGRTGSDDDGVEGSWCAHRFMAFTLARTLSLPSKS